MVISKCASQMKKCILYLTIVLSLAMVACQSDDSQQSTAPTGLTPTSPLSLLVSRVAQYPTAQDNVLDGTDAFAVALPVTVTVNGITLTVDGNDNCHDVQEIIDAHSNDDDIIHFTFPIRLIYQNHQQVQVTSQAQYQAILANCPPNNGQTEIECIDINYPIVINSYNTATQTPTTVTITSNAQLYGFIQGLTAADLFSFVYPFSMTKSNGEVINITSDATLQAAIQNSVGTCNDDTSNGELANVIVDGTWYVSSFIDDDHDETYEFNGYNFTFAANGNVTAVKNTTTINGTWQHKINGGFSKLDLNFTGSMLQELEEDWQVLEYTETMIKLRHENGGGSDMHYLTFSKN